jgi:hypothetical protein
VREVREVGDQEKEEEKGEKNLLQDPVRRFAARSNERISAAGSSQRIQ